MSRRPRPASCRLMGEEDWTGLGGGCGSNWKTHFISSAFKSGEDLDAVDLKRLYVLLLHHLSSSSSLFKQEEILHLSHVLFTQLENRFKEHVFSSSFRGDVSVAHLVSPSEFSDLLLLLRCCLLLLTLTAFDYDLLLEKGKLIFSILARLFSISTNLLSPTGESVASIAPLESSLPYHHFLCEVIEVFADELLAHKLLRHVFIRIDATAPRSNMIFSSHLGHANIGCILEVLCSHFIISFSHAQAFENFINRLFWHCEGHFRTPQICLSAILSLLSDPIISSAPKLFQAYLVLLASDALGISTSSESTKPDLSYIECYVMACERSFFLYSRHMCSLHVDGHPFCLNASPKVGENSMYTFESLLQPATRDKLHHLISKSNYAWDSYLSKRPSTANYDLVATSIAYVKDNLYNFDESHKDEVLSILSSVLLGASSDGAGDKILHTDGEARPQDIYLLASLLKLMSSSLLQAICHIRSLHNSGCLKSLGGVSSCEKYDAIMDTFSCCEQFPIQLPIQKFLHEMLQSHPAIHSKSLRMFLHFSGLLSLSYGCGLDFLVKDCLFTLLTLLSLYIIEEGDLKVLGSLLSSRLEAFPSKAPDNTNGALVIHKTSLKISLKVKKIQKMYLRTHSLICGEKQHEETETTECASNLIATGSSASIIEAEKPCNGEVFLKCLLGNNGKGPDLDDLADFIECKQGMDYSAWLDNREKFRRWSTKKASVLRRKRKKNMRNSLKGR